MTEGKVPLKKRVQDALGAADFGKVTELALRNKSVFRVLISSAYDKDDLLCWRAIEAMGRAAGAVATKDPVTVRNIVQRLIWSVSDESGGIGWSAPEMLGEIALHCPETCGDIPSIILSFHTEEIFLKGVLWAIGRIAGAEVDGMQGSGGIVLAALNHRDPSVRGLALYALGRSDVSEAEGKVKEMVYDEGRFRIYEGHELVETKVGDMARRVLDGRGGREAT
ncbi:MAG: HEAT repeat domain-containing protein [Nitrospirae bacterium]|nr:HEAT repeat domain-containing protein [Nitrospirota bacterium]